jgi:hypothetical protein
MQHDFDFWFGTWRVKNTVLKARLKQSDDWETFEATAIAQPILGGLGNIDGFEAPTWRGGFVGMSLRLYNPATAQWSIYWASSKTGILEPPVSGIFQNGIGIFEGDDVFEGIPIRVRFVWSEITKQSARWEQFFSSDEGNTWEKNWIMEFERVST